MTSMRKVEQGIANFFDKELMPKLPETGYQRVIAGVAISLGIKRLSEAALKSRENGFVKMLKIMDEDGNVDVDVLKVELEKQIKDTGLRLDFPVIGPITFHKDDVQSLYEYIINA